MARRPAALLFSLWLAVATGAFAAQDNIEFHMDRYVRDLHTNTVKGKGHTYIRRGTQEIWADEVEVDFNAKRAIANGNVHIRDGEVEIWCRNADYNLSGEDAILDDATLLSGQLVVTGQVIRKLNKVSFEIDEGTYTNCNLSLVKDAGAGGCQFDWKIYGRHLSVTMEEYVSIRDALIYLNRTPVFYTPYFIAPVKSKRQSGLLMPHFTYAQYLGNGIELPYFVALAPWHDLTIDPTYYLSESIPGRKQGYHIGLDYRYAYAPDKYGFLNFNFTQWRFSANPANDPRPEDASRPEELGLIGEWSLFAHNFYAFPGSRAQSRQTLRLVSNPYYTQYFSADLDYQTSLAALRSQVSFTAPGDGVLLTAEARHFQSILISTDYGVDKGAPTELPTVTFSKTTSPALAKYLSYEVDTRLTNFYRPAEFDALPLLPSATPVGQLPAAGGAFNSSLGDYIRTGQRLQIEPRLIANIPMPPGFQLQPMLAAGMLGYHFDLPTPQFIYREYVDTELPLSLYLSKTLDTPFSGLEKISHVIQPRVIYAASAYSTPDPNHPFFYRTTPPGQTASGVALSNPRFDITDFLTPYEYMRFELINRFRRKTLQGNERFFLLKLSEQYNLKTQQGVDPRLQDPRYQQRYGPVELLTEFRLGRILFQAQADYQIDPLTQSNGRPIHEYDWSSSISYLDPGFDHVTVNTLFRNRADPALIEQTLTLDAYKTLPTFFNIGGTLEYSMRLGDLLGYQVRFDFAAKPRSCWSVSLVTGRNALKQPFASFNFSLQFGEPGGFRPM